MEERMKIMPNDTVFHNPSGETWIVCGVNRKSGMLVPCGWPFPTFAKIEDCELIERRGETEYQTQLEVNALKRHGLDSYIENEARNSPID